MKISTLFWSSALTLGASVWSAKVDNYLTPAHEELILNGGEKFEYQVRNPLFHSALLPS